MTETNSKKKQTFSTIGSNYSKDSGRAIFECGCTISVKNLKSSKIGSFYKCQIHKAQVKYIDKKCAWCKEDIPFQSIAQILNRDFCSIDCIKKSQAAYKQYYEDNPPEKKPDCTYYKECLDKAGVQNKYDIGCSTCNRYKKDEDYYLS